MVLPSLSIGEQAQTWYLTLPKEGVKDDSYQFQHLFEFAEDGCSG
jgi:hypothetical protein